MNGRKQAYEKFVRDHPAPPNIKDYPNRAFDYPSMIAYAKKEGKSAADLSEAERKQFIRK